LIITTYSGLVYLGGGVTEAGGQLLLANINGSAPGLAATLGTLGNALLPTDILPLNDSTIDNTADKAASAFGETPKCPRG
jgi:hypothetical protein